MKITLYRLTGDPRLNNLDERRLAIEGPITLPVLTFDGPHRSFEMNKKTGGGTVEEAPCREALDRVLKSLREAMPVHAVFLRLYGAMYAEGVGPAEAVLVGKVRSLVGPKVPIACTFDLHGNIPARLADSGDILVGLKTAPHTDGGPTAELAGRILLDTLGGKARSR
jgi:microcystin degradation protein MlrC